MELLRPEDRDRLLNLRNSSNLPSTTTSPRPASSSSASSSCSSLQQQQEALAAWKGQTSTQTFRPFEKNPSKQARYELYLNRMKQGDKDALEQSLDSGMTEWERSREREEFVRASILYRPTTSSLSSRFTRAKNQEDDDTVEVSRDDEGDVDDKQAAVTMKMFGKLTRETFEWHPDKLLCKRFNVPDPYPGSGVVGMPKVKRDKFSVFNFLTVTESREATAPPKPPESSRRSRWDISDQKEVKKISDPLSELLSAARNQTSETKSDRTSVPALPASTSNGQTADIKTETKSADQANSGKKKGDDEEEEQEEEENRPSMDLFKAIFASSSDEKSSSSEGESEDDDDEKENTKEDQAEVESHPLKLFNITSTSTVSSSSLSSSTVTSSQQTAVVFSQTSTQEEEEFGPKLPPPSAALIRGGGTSVCSPSEEEKPSKRSKEKKHKNKKQHKHKKDKKKKKHKKHKHKGKEQKKSKKEALDSSSEDSDGEGQVSTDELLKRLKSIRSHQTW